MAGRHERGDPAATVGVEPEHERPEDLAAGGDQHDGCDARTLTALQRTHGAEQHGPRGRPPARARALPRCRRRRRARSCRGTRRRGRARGGRRPAAGARSARATGRRRLGTLRAARRRAHATGRRRLGPPARGAAARARGQRMAAGRSDPTRGLLGRVDRLGPRRGVGTDCGAAAPPDHSAPTVDAAGVRPRNPTLGAPAPREAPGAAAPERVARAARNRSARAPTRRRRARRSRRRAPRPASRAA